jgi:maltooligosyltrehalose trehalohydrolase
MEWLSPIVAKIPTDCLEASHFTFYRIIDEAPPGPEFSSRKPSEMFSMKNHPVFRRLPVGAEVQATGGVHFRVWAPRRSRVEVTLELGAHAATVYALEAESAGYFSGLLLDAAPGMLYRYRLDRENSYPDPASRFQPHGPDGPSQIVDPANFAWTDHDWRGTRLAGQVIYEMHVGTFTREGTWESAARELKTLAASGVTILEIMPVADFTGSFGWGYDGVDLYAPTRLYGTPDDFRRFVDHAHCAGLAVILDVVYNHFGEDGAYFTEFANDYFTDRYENEWGRAINFDGKNSAPVREFIIANAGYWVDEFHIDGLRLDATQQIFDSTSPHVLAEITRCAREAAHGRGIIIVAENEPQDVKLIRPVERDGYGMDALWNDDFHHTAVVALTGRKEAYYTDYHGTPQEFVSAVKWGTLYQGQYYSWQKQRRGTPALGTPPAGFINFIQNHDQIANTGSGLRLHGLTSPGRYRAITALMLLAPGTPMLFQGQEFASSSPFLFFADHRPELAAAVRKGRAQFLTQFPSMATPATQQLLPDPGNRETFERCKLDQSERERHSEAYALHRDLLRLRKEDAAFSYQQADALDGAVLGPETLLIRFFDEKNGDRLLLVNLGADLHLKTAPEPLLAPPEKRCWEILWSSENPRYGGAGTPAVETDEGWRIPGHAAIVLMPQPLATATEES